MRTLRLPLACFVILALLVLPGGAVAGDSVEYAPPPSIDPSLVPDADGFVFEEVAPGVRRLVTDGAGHFPSATYIREARDMDEVAVDDQGQVLVWSTTHGIDNDIAEDSQLWILGEEGVLDPAEGPARPSERSGWWGEPVAREAPDGSTWLVGWEYGGVIRSGDETTERFLPGHELGSLAITPDGRAWLTEGHGSGGAGAIYVVEPDAVGEPVEDGALLATIETAKQRAALEAAFIDALEDLPPLDMSGPAPAWERVLDLGDRRFDTMIAADSGLWAIEGGRSQPSVLWYSADGAAWTQLDTAALLGDGAIVSEISEGGPGLLAIGSVPSGAGREAVAWTSADGQSWTVSPLGYTTPEPERAFEVSELLVHAVAAGPDGAVIAAMPEKGIDYGLLEPSVAAAVPTSLREYASGRGVMIDPWAVSVSVGPFTVFSAPVSELDVDQDLFDAYRWAVDGGPGDRLLFATDDYLSWQRTDEWPATDPIYSLSTTPDGYLATTWGWGSSPAAYASPDGLSWEAVDLPAGVEMGQWLRAEGDRLLMSSDVGGRSALWTSEDGGETWTAWAGLPDDAWDVQVGAFGLVATGEHPSDWWEGPQGTTTVVEQDGLTLSVGPGPAGCTVTGLDGSTLLSADCLDSDDGLGGLALPSFMEADNDRAVFTVTDPSSDDPLMTIPYREMEDAYELAQGPAGLGADTFVAYSADGLAWSVEPVAELAGLPGWIGSVAVGDDFAVIDVSPLDGPTSLWRATIR